MGGKKKESKEKLIPISEAAKLLDVSIATLRRWDKKGIIHPIRRGRYRYFSLEELERIKLSQPLSVTAAAQLCGISSTTLRRLEEKEVIVPKRDENGKRWYSKKILEEFLESEYFLSKKKVQAQILQTFNHPQKKDSKKDEKKTITIKENLEIRMPGKTRHRKKKILLRACLKLISIVSIIFVSVSLSLIAGLTILFLIQPDSAQKFFDEGEKQERYESRTMPTTLLGIPKAQAAEVGAEDEEEEEKADSEQIAKKALRPFATIALGLVRFIDEEKYDRAVESVAKKEPLSSQNESPLEVISTPQPRRGGIVSALPSPPQAVHGSADSESLSPEFDLESLLEQNSKTIRFNEHGKVGIGTSDPEAMFHVGGDVSIDGDLHIGGIISHESPVLIEEALSFLDKDGKEIFGVGIHGKGLHEDHNIPDALNGTLIFDTEEVENESSMEVTFWSSETNRPALIITEVGKGSAGNRASTFDRSVQIGKTLGRAAVNENYTRFEGFHFIDGNTETTGADLGVEDDIEAKGSIYAQEDLTAEGGVVTLGAENASRASQLVFHDADSTDAFTTRIVSHQDLTGDITLILPSAVGEEGQVLLTDGSGNLSWGDNSRLPKENGRSGQFLSTDSSGKLSWEDMPARFFGRGGASNISSLSGMTITNPVAGNLLIYDGVDSWDNQALSGEASIDAAGVLTIADDAIDFTELSDTLAVDAPTSIATGTNTLSFTGILDFSGASLFGASPLVFEGASTDDFETLFSITDPTSDNTITIPNASGTLVLSGHTFTGDVSATVDTDGSTELTLAADAVALGTDTTGDYLATLADSGNSTITVSGSGTESAIVTLDVVGVNCTDCLNTTHIADVYLSNAGDNATGNYDYSGAVFLGASPFVLEGNTANDFETTLAITDPTADQIVTLPDASGTVLLDGGASTLLTLDGDTGTSQALNSGNTINIVGGTNGIDTVVGATDTITLNIDTVEIGTTTFGGGSSITWTFDASAGTDTRIAFGDDTIAFTSGSTSFTGDVTVSGGDLTLGNTTILSGGDTTSLDNIDAISAITETTFEAAIDIAGDVAGTGLGAVQIQPDAVALGTDTMGNFVNDILAGVGINVTHTPGEGSAATIASTLGTSISNAELDDDTIDFDKISDTLSLDADISIAAGAGEEITINKVFTDATGENGAVYTFTASDTTSGTTSQVGLYLDNAASTEALDTIITIDNSDLDDAVGVAIQFTNAGGGFTSLFDVAGTLISVAEFTILDGGIDLDELNDSGILTAGTVDINGGAIDGTAIGASSASSGAFTTLSSTGATTIGNNSATVAIDSSDWDISATGAFTGAGLITADGLITGTAGLTISGAATSINANSNFATNINTGTSTGAITLGGGNGTVAINSSDWDIDATGAITGVAFDANGTGNSITNVDLTADVIGTLPVASGGTGATTLNDLITLGTHTTGNYVATIADAGSSDITVNNSGSESAAVTLDIADDSLDFTELADTLTIDATTNIASGTLRFDDNAILALGTGTDLQITHTATNTVLTSATGNLVIDNTNATGATQVQLGTDTAATDFQVLNNTGNVLAEVDGSGDIQQNAQNPLHAGAITDGGSLELNGAGSIHVQGDYAYVLGRDDGGIQILDISDPTSPTSVGFLDDDGSTLFAFPRDMDIQGDYAYIVGNDNALEILDISDPTNPTHAGSIADDATTELSVPFGIYVRGSYAYIASAGGAGAVQILDISDPTNPVHAGNIVDNGSTRLLGAADIYVQGNYAYVVAIDDNSVEILDVSDPTNPIHAGSITDGVGTVLAEPLHIYVQGNYAYVTSTGESGVEILDVSDPTNPTHAGSITDDGTTALSLPYEIYVQGNYAYIANSGSDDGVQVLDVSDPTNPTHAGVIADDVTTALNGAQGIFVRGKYAYVAATADDGMEVLELTGTALPTADIGSVQSGSLHVDGISQFSGDVVADGGLSAISGQFDGEVAVTSRTGKSALDVVDISTSTTASTTEGLEFTVNDTGIVTTGTDALTGLDFNVTRTGATGGTINTIGLDLNVVGDNAGSGTSTVTGLTVDVSGADTNYAALLNGGNVGIGDSTPAALLSVGSGDLFQVNSSGIIANIDGVAHTIEDVSGDFSINSNGGQILFADGDTLNIGGLTGVVYNAFSDSGTADIAASDDDVYVEDVLEVDGELEVDGALDADGVITLGDNGDTVAIDSSDWDISTTGAITGVSFDANGTGNSISNVDLTADITGTLPVANGGTGVTTLNNLITLGTHTTGNYVATIADAGAGDITVSGSGSETAAVTLDIADDALDFTELADSLSIDTAAIASGTLTFNDSTILALGTSNDFTVSHGGTNTVFDNTFATGATQFQLGTDTDATAFQILNNSGTNIFEVDGSGDVGIGDTTPDGKLEVRQTGTDDIFNLYDNTTNVLSVKDGGITKIGGWDQDGLGTLTVSDRIGAGLYQMPGVSFDDTVASFLVNSDHINVNEANALTFLRPGQDGVVYNGLARLDIGRWESNGVNSRTSLSFKLAHETHNSVTEILELQSGGNVLVPNGNVGIGTTSPQSLLDVRAAAGSKGLVTIASDELTVIDGDILGQIDFNAPLESDGSDAILVGASIWAEADDTFSTTVNSTELVFATGSSAAAAEKVRIDSAGNVGIGDSTPAALLSVGNGDLFQVNSSGIIATIDGVAHVIDDVSGDLQLNSNGGQILFADGDTLNIGGLTGVAYNAFSDSGTANIAASDDDVYVEDVLEVDGELELDGTLDADGAADFSGGLTNSTGELLISGGNVQLNDSINLTFGTGDDFAISHGGTNTVFDNTFVTGATQFQLGTDTDATAFQVLNNSGANLFEVDGAGNVGIGTSSPSSHLDISATAPKITLTDTDGVGTRPEIHTTGGDVLLFTNDDSGVTLYDFYSAASDTRTNDATVRIYGDESGSFTNYLSLTHTGAGGDGSITTASGDLVLGSSTGNVGIGTGAPSSTFDIVDVSTDTTAGTTEGLEFTVSDTGVVTTGTDALTGLDFNITRTGATGGTINTIGLDLDVTGDTGGTSTLTGLDVNVSGADTNYAALFNGGNVGIGTTDPGSADLMVSGGTSNGLGQGNSDVWIGESLTRNLVLAWKDAATDYAVVETFAGSGSLVLQSAGGNVGIGTTSPAYELEVSDEDSTVSFLIDAEGTSHGEAQLRLNTNSSSNDWLLYMDDISLNNLNDADDLSFFYSTVGNVLTLKGDTGHIGIGETSPGNILEIQKSAGHSYLNIDTDNNTAYDSGIRLQQNGTDQWVMFSDHGDGNLYFNENTSDTRMVIQAGGNVGIGDTSPDQALDVDGNIAMGNDNYLYLHGDTDTNWRFGKSNSNTIDVHGATGSGRAFRILEGVADTEVFRVEFDGNVGIGDTTPDVALTVYAANDGEDARFGRSDSEHFSIEVQDSHMYLDYEQDSDSNGTHTFFIRNNAYLSSSGENDIQFQTGGTTVLTIEDNDAEVGIGTTDPSGPLHVVESSGSGNFYFDGEDFATILLRSDTNNDGPADPSLRFYANNNTFRGEIGIDDTDSDKLKLHTGGSAGFSGSSGITIDTSGNVGIGVTDPAATLEVKTSSTTTNDPIAIFTAGDDRTLRIEQPDNADSNDPFIFQTGTLFSSRQITTQVWLLMLVEMLELVPIAQVISWMYRVMTAPSQLRD